MATIILFAPLIGALLCGFGWRLIGETAAQVITTGAAVPGLRCCRWIMFLTFDGETPAHPPAALDRQSGTLVDRLGDPARPADGDHAGGGDHGLGARAPLFSFGYMAHDENWHAGRALQGAVLRLSVVLHLRHADAGDRRQPGADVLRLGRGGRRLLPADRVLLPQAIAPMPPRSRPSWSTGSATSALRWASSRCST